jgi:hypothetical protein
VPDFPAHFETVAVSPKRVRIPRISGIFVTIVNAKTGGVPKGTLPVVRVES